MRYLLAACIAALTAALAATSFAARSVDTGNVLLADAATAIFAGGCFWCIEADFEKLPGVIEAESGYAGGGLADPDYKSVSDGKSGHAEVAKIYYDPGKISYRQLVEFFWRHVDPTVKDRQFCDVGSQYRTAIFYANEQEKAAALASKSALENSGRFKNVFTEIVPAGKFYRAEEYHQDYYRKNPLRYNFYRTTCGRDARIAELWGK